MVRGSMVRGHHGKRVIMVRGLGCHGNGLVGGGGCRQGEDLKGVCLGHNIP